MEAETPSSGHRSRALTLFGRIGRTLLVAGLALCFLWAVGAIYYDGPWPGAGNATLSVFWLALSLTAVARLRRQRALVTTLALGLVALPWSMKRPSNHRDWAPEYARTPDAAVQNDVVTFTNFRNFDYKDDGTIDERWETRRVRLSNLRGVDFFLNQWGSEWIGHPIFSFDFGEDGRIAFSIETRREKGETFTTTGGLFKLYELTCLPADEHDVIRVRTNVREDEDTYLYRLAVSPEAARQRFLEYVALIQELARQPRFYHVITANCTTALRSQVKERQAWVPDIRLLLNGRLDEMIADRGMFAVKDLPAHELKARGHINANARASGDHRAFSDRIRQGVPGF